MSSLSSLISDIVKHPNLQQLTEAQVRQNIILPILQSLGWPTVFDSKAEVRPEYQIKSLDSIISVDFALLSQDKPLFLIEVKKAGANLSQPKTEQQILNYAFNLGVNLALLTNGLEWRFYLPLQKGPWQQRLFDSFSLSDSVAVDRLSLFLSKNSVLNGQAFHAANQQFQSNRFSQAFPSAWNQLVNQPSSALIQQLQESIQQVSNHRPEAQTVKGLIDAYAKQIQISSILDSTPPLISNSPLLQQAESTYLKIGKNQSSIDHFLQDAEAIRLYANKQGWSLDYKFNQNYCGFKIGHSLVFGLKWSGKNSYDLFVHLTPTQADTFALSYSKVESNSKAVYYQLIPGQIDLNLFDPMFQLAYLSKGKKNSVLDTIVVPARREGFQQVFIQQNAWWAIKIASHRLTEIKYIAAYQSAPVSAITHWAEVSHIEPHGAEGKYALYFKAAAQQISPINLEGGQHPQAPRYTNLQRLLQAKSMSQVFSSSD